MSSRKSKKHNKSRAVKKILIEAPPPAIVVVTKDKIQRLKDCNPNKSFTMLLFYFGLLFPCALELLNGHETNMTNFVLLLCVSVMLFTLSLKELISYIKKRELFNKILNEMESEVGKILLDQFHEDH